MCYPQRDCFVISCMTRIHSRWSRREGQKKWTQGQPAQQECFLYADAVIGYIPDRKSQVTHQLAKSISWWCRNHLS